MSCKKESNSKSINQFSQQAAGWNFFTAENERSGVTQADHPNFLPDKKSDKSQIKAITGK